jgi:hypothetical protein
VIAAFGTGITQANEKFVRRHGISIPAIKRNPEVCHIPPWLDSRLSI